jgi:uncharacterized delta-60 repeat protein
MLNLPRFRSRAAKSPKGNRIRLRLEVLEDRNLPSGSAPNLLLGLDTLSTPLGIMAVQRQIALPNGEELQVGTIQSQQGSWDFAIARTTPHGRLDRDFGSGGVVETPIPNGASSSNFAADIAYDVLVQPDGKYVVVGNAQGYGYYGMALARYNPNGSLDTSFGTNGTVFTDNGEAVSVALQGDGKIVVAGESSQIPGQPEFTVARFTANGQLDTSFGNSGFVEPSFNGQTASLADSVVVQPNGQIVVAGTASAYVEYNDVIAVGFRRPPEFEPAPSDVITRLNPDGALDTSFGNGGTIVIPQTPWTTAGVVGVNLGGNGTITLVDGSSTIVVFEGAPPVTTPPVATPPVTTGGGTSSEPPVATSPVGPKLPTTEGPQQSEANGGDTSESIAETAPTQTEATSGTPTSSTVQGEAPLSQTAPINNPVTQTTLQTSLAATSNAIVADNAITQTTLLTSLLLRPNASGPFDSDRWVMAITDDDKSGFLPIPDAAPMDMPVNPADAVPQAPPAKQVEPPVPDDDQPSMESDEG